MRLRTLNKAELKAVYRTEMKRAFPPAELKPLASMEQLRVRGCYDPLGLYDGEELLAYAMLWHEPGVPFVLLDYLGTVEDRRGGGIGSDMLRRLGEHYAADYRGIIAESEGPYSDDEEERALQQRRLGFYYRNGFRDIGYDCALFGVHYRTLLLGDEQAGTQEVLTAHQTIYRGQIPGPIYKRFVQIPLGPGERPNPATEWKEREL